MSQPEVNAIEAAPTRQAALEERQAIFCQFPWDALDLRR